MKKNTNNSIKIIMITISVGIWAIVFQNFGVLPMRQNVFIEDGHVNASIDRTVNVRGEVNVSGNVDVDNTVDINIRQILGRSAAAYHEYYKGGEEYLSLGVR